MVGTPGVREVVGMKPAQIGWTDGVIANLLGAIIDEMPAPTIMMFPRELSAKEFNREKFEPMVEATPRLQSRVSIKRRAQESTQTFKDFLGGFLKLVGSNSPASVKSTAGRFLIVEEPDDCNANLRGQGDAITLLRKRGTTFHDAVMVVGGTPTIEGISAIEAEIERSDKRHWHVPCHDCGTYHLPRWENVRWREDQTAAHPVYGTAVPESAYYVCPHCGSIWDEMQKNANVRRGEWRAERPMVGGVVGFVFAELMSPFPEATMAALAAEYLTADHARQRGDITKMVTFWNTSLGRSWRFQSSAPALEQLQERCEAYPMLTVPAGGLVLTVGVDVQHDRLAVIVRAWGRGEESWLVWWGELYGSTVDKAGAVWQELDEVLFRTYAHASGAELGVRGATIDSGDGVTADAVYAYVRTRRAQMAAGQRPRIRLMAGKGATKDSAEIFRRPAPSIDPNAKHKAAKYGLRVYMVGAGRAKDLIVGTPEGPGRLGLQGNGPGRMHVYTGVRSDYFDQLLAEVKAPLPRSADQRRLVWQLKAGARNEALDCECLALHAARALQLELWSNTRWSELERQLLQASLFDQGEDTDSDGGEIDQPAGEPARAAAPPAAAPVSSDEPALEEPQEPALEAVAAAPIAPRRRPARPPQRPAVSSWTMGWRR